MSLDGVIIHIEKRGGDLICEVNGPSQLALAFLLVSRFMLDKCPGAFEGEARELLERVLELLGESAGGAGGRFKFPPTVMVFK